MDDTKNPKRWAIGTAIEYRSFVVTMMAYLLIVNILTGIFCIPIALQGQPDFRQLYTAGYMLRTGHASQLYDLDAEGELQIKLAGPLGMTLPFNHLAYETLIFAPLSLLTFRAAYLVFFGVNLALLAASFFLMKPFILSLGKIWKWLPPALFLCFYPVAVAAIQGQDSIIIMTLMIAAFVSLQKKQDVLAGALVSLTLFKLQFGIPIFLLFVAWKWWRCAFGFLAAGLAAVGISLGIAGFAGTSVYLKSLVSMSVALKTAQQQDFYGIHPAGMPNIRGLVTVLTDSYVSHSWTQIVTIALSALLLFLAARSRPSFSLAILVSVLVSYHSLIHDTSMLLIPIGLLGAAAVKERLPHSEWTAALAAIVLIAPTLLTQTSGRPWLLALPTLALTGPYLWQMGPSHAPSINDGACVTKSI